LVHLVGRDGRGALLQGLGLGLDSGGVGLNLSLNFLRQLFHAGLHGLTNGRLSQNALVEINAYDRTSRAGARRALGMGTSGRGGQRSKGEGSDSDEFHNLSLSDGGQAAVRIGWRSRNGKSRSCRSLRGSEPWTGRNGSAPSANASGC